MNTDDIREKFGLPDWKKASSYGDTSSWILERWRWEFLRRRQDVRDSFHANKDRTHQVNISCASDGEKVDGPDDPGFWAMTVDSKPFGMTGIPNPSIGDQPLLEGLFSQRVQLEKDGEIEKYEDFLTARKRSGLLRHQIAIVFDTRLPLEDQVNQARELLRLEKVASLSRDNKGKWLQHLRVLDARECGAHLREIGSLIFPNNDHPTQSAWSAFKSAKEVRERM
jgi:hypothetical protein